MCDDWGPDRAAIRFFTVVAVGAALSCGVPVGPLFESDSRGPVILVAGPFP